MKPFGMIIAATLLLSGAAFADAPEKAEIFGTIVSVRGNILQIRPNLRPKMVRASFGDKTEALSYRQIEKEDIKPGMRVQMGGMYSEKGGYAPFFLVAGKEALGPLKEKGGIKPDGPGDGWANAYGTLKSVDPLIFADDAGKEYTAKSDKLRRFFEIYRGDRNSLLIGTRIQLIGVPAPDGVIQAESITVDKDYAASGTMFGTIVSVKDRTLIVRPRYTQDAIEVDLTEDAKLQREVFVDPDTITVGKTVTFWGQLGKEPDKKNELRPVALLLGDGRYPAATEGDEAAQFYTGILTSIDPAHLQLPDKTTLNVVIPAQMATARIVPLFIGDLKPGSSVMLVLKRIAGDKFTTARVLKDASPFVGYGG